MLKCKLCGIQIEVIPHDAILVGKLHRFVDGSFHLLRKLVPRSGPRPRKHKTNPDQEAPLLMEPTNPTPLTPRGLHASDVPEHVPAPVETPEDAVPVGESLMARAFRLKKVA
jgi:hypothetical protein